MFSLSLTIFGRYLSLNMGRVEDAWEDDVPEPEHEPEDEADVPTLDKPEPIYCYRNGGAFDDDDG